MLIAHLSDPHITTGALAAAPATGLHHALGRVLGLDPRPDCVVITGDLVNTGRPDEYAALLEIIGAFPLPLHLVTGNHDNVAALLDAVPGGPLVGGPPVGGLDGRVTYRVAYPEATIIVLDSHIPGDNAGRLGAEQLAWLDQTLSERPQVPAVICLHHPPVPVGIPFMDDMRLLDGAALAAVVGRHRNVARVLAGHLHRAVSAGFAGSVLSVAPSTYRQIDLGLRPDAPPGYLAEPTGFLLHRLAGTDCVTHTVAVSHAGAQLGAF